jgi:hypothetical protein
MIKESALEIVVIHDEVEERGLLEQAIASIGPGARL